MPKAKLSQIATTWVEEKDTLKGRRMDKIGSNKNLKAQLKKKQTFNLKLDTIKCLWMHRVETGRTISGTIDDLVFKHIPR